MLLCCWMSDDDRFELLRLIQQSGIEPVVGREDDRRCTSASVLRQKKKKSVDKRGFLLLCCDFFVVRW